jgi:hypothetical protein
MSPTSYQAAPPRVRDREGSLGTGSVKATLTFGRTYCNDQWSTLLNARVFSQADVVQHAGQTKGQKILRGYLAAQGQLAGFERPISVGRHWAWSVELGAWSVHRAKSNDSTQEDQQISGGQANQRVGFRNWEERQLCDQPDSSGATTRSRFDGATNRRTSAPAVGTLADCKSCSIESNTAAGRQVPCRADDCVHAF